MSDQNPSSGDVTYGLGCLGEPVRQQWCSVHPLLTEPCEACMRKARQASVAEEPFDPRPRCPVHSSEREPCPTCRGYIAGGL